MQKLLLFVSILMLCFVSSCDDIEDLADIEIEVTESTTFLISDTSFPAPQEMYIDVSKAFPGGGDISGEFSEEIDISDNNDFDKYDDYIKSIEIVVMDYKVLQNSGFGGNISFSVGPLTTPASTYADARKITEDIVFPLAETTPLWQPVIFTSEKAYFEDMFLNEKKMMIWVKVAVTDVALASIPTSGTAIEIVIRVKVKITANPFEKL